MYDDGMDLEQIRAFLDDSPTIRLLRAEQGAFVLDFLRQTFKGNAEEVVITYPQDELRTRLTVYQEELHTDDPQVLVGPADRYLLAWSDAGWLRRFLQADSTQPHYQLTRFTEDALRFVDSAVSRRSRMVGTESRLRLVIETLTDVVRGASDDPDLRLARLRSDRQAIDDEIAAIEAGGPVRTYRPAQIRERFHTAVDLLKTLQGDFRAVEDRFQEIAQQVQRESQSDSRTRGEILADALDAEDLLKEQDEGISFYAFVSFLFSPDSQRELRQTIQEVMRLDALADDRDAVEHVRQMVPSLLTEAEKVLKTTGRLSQTLRRLLDAESAQHRRRTAEVLRDIRTLAAKVRRHVVESDEAISDDIGMHVETSLGLSSPMSRPPWSAPQVFEQHDAQEHTVDLRKAEAAGRQLARMQRLDLDRMRQLVRKATAHQSAVTMSQLVEQRPPRAGVMELVGWLQIAHEDGHRIDTDASEEIVIDCGSRGAKMQPAADDGDASGDRIDEAGFRRKETADKLRVVVPLVTFCPKNDASTSEVPRKRPR